MSKWQEKTKRPVLPVYMAALVWPIMALLVPIYTLGGLVLTAAVSAGAYFAASGSCAPQLWAMTTPAPLQSPTNRPTSRLTKGPVAPTAASAFVPTKLPTIRVSAVLYSCWNSVPNQMGRKNRSSCLGMLPVRISVCLTLFIEFLSLFCFSQPHFML